MQERAMPSKNLRERFDFIVSAAQVKSHARVFSDAISKSSRCGLKKITFDARKQVEHICISPTSFNLRIETRFYFVQG